MHSRHGRWTLIVGILTLPVAAWGASGSLLWQDRFAAGFDPTAHVAVEGTRVFVAGKGLANSASGTAWLVRAYESKTGSVVWQDALLGSDNKAGSIVARGDLVFAGGFVINAADTADVALLRAYDAQTGALRWEDRFDYGGFFATVNAIAVADDQPRVIAVGRGQHAGFNTNDWIVRAYDAQTGALLWQDVFDSGPFDEARSVAVHGGRVFVSGVSTDSGFRSRRFTVRAYDAGTGTLLWQDRVPSGNRGFFGADAAHQVAVEGDRLVAAGVVTDATGFHFAVRAYDARSGTLLWSDLVDKGDGADFASSVTLHDGRAFVVGLGGAACSFGLPSNCDWLIRAYDQRTGALIWERQVDREGGDADQANVVLAHGDQIVVAGGAGTSPTEPFADWLVQVYAAENGALVWEDLLGTPGTFAFPVGLAVAGNRLFVTGSTVDLAGGTQNGDWIVRAHELGGH